MSKVKTISSGEKFTHASVGAISGFAGKAFLKDATGSTSCEISFGTLSNGEAVPFFHCHNANEENYIILSGAGRFQVDSEVFDITEGSVIRVTATATRNLKCTSTEPLVYICIQAKEDSLEGYTMTDGVLSECESLL